MLVVLLASCTFADDFVQDFEQGLGGATSYHKAPDASQIELATVGAASGKQYLRTTLPGNRPLEGFRVSATGLTGERLATVTAQVRGQGDIWLCLISRNGWLYSPRTIALTDRWQEISLSKVLVAKDQSLGINFLSRDVQPGAVFEVDDVRVKLAPLLETYATEVGPWRLEAEDFAPRSDYVVAQADALGGKLVADNQYVVVRGLPFPRTNQPVTIYALFECAEPILNTAQQRRHEFAAKVTSRDGKVDADDSAVLLLDPANGGLQVYDFTVNALGTINDARCNAPDLWTTRDVKWNSRAMAKGQIGEDAWSVEIAIPFADLGRTPRMGDMWQACLGRIAKARKETSAWNLSDKGLHDPVELGGLVFGGSTPGVVADPPRSLQLGPNQLRVALTPTPDRTQGVYLLSALGLASGNRSVCSFHALADKPFEASQRFELAAEAEVRTAHAVLDAGSLQPLYLTPGVTRAVKSSLATLTLTCPGPYELCLNDEVISRGASARMAEIKAPLQRGANVFALSLRQGTAALKLVAPGNTSDALSWKIAPEDARTATAAALDDGRWPMAPQVGTDPQLGPLVGRSEQAVVLRKTILWEKTRVWPTPEPAFYLAHGPAQHLTYCLIARAACSSTTAPRWTGAAGTRWPRPRGWWRRMKTYS